MRANTAIFKNNPRYDNSFIRNALEKIGFLANSGYVYLGEGTNENTANTGINFVSNKLTQARKEKFELFYNGHVNGYCFDDLNLNTIYNQLFEQDTFNLYVPRKVVLALVVKTNESKLMQKEFEQLRKALSKSSYIFKHVYTAHFENYYDSQFFFLATNYDCPFLWNCKLYTQDGSNSIPKMNKDSFVRLGSYQNNLKQFVLLDDSADLQKVKVLLEEMEQIIQKRLLTRKDTKNYLLTSKIDFIADRISEDYLAYTILPPIPLTNRFLLGFHYLLGDDLDRFDMFRFDCDDLNRNLDLFKDFIKSHPKLAEYLAKKVSDNALS